MTQSHVTLLLETCKKDSLGKKPKARFHFTLKGDNSASCHISKMMKALLLSIQRYNDAKKIFYTVFRLRDGPGIRFPSSQRRVV